MRRRVMLCRRPCNVFYLQYFNCGLLHVHARTCASTRARACVHVPPLAGDIVHSHHDASTVSRRFRRIVTSIYESQRRLVDAGVHVCVLVHACVRVREHCC